MGTCDGLVLVFAKCGGLGIECGAVGVCIRLDWYVFTAHGELAFQFALFGIRYSVRAVSL